MILERLKEYIDYKSITIAAFERSVGMSNGSFGKALKNCGAIGSDKLENILSIYDEISAEWLLSGVGPMLKSEVNTESNCCKDCNQTYAGDDFRDKDNEKHPINKPILYNKEDWMQDTLSEPCSNAVQTLMKHEAVHRAATPSADILTPLLDRIQQQAEEIGALKERIRKMEEEREKLAAAARSSVVADAG